MRNSGETQQLDHTQCLSQSLEVNDTQLFSIDAPFPALSVLMVFPDKCQMISFKDINILMKVKLFWLKNLFWEKLLFETIF